MVLFFSSFFFWRVSNENSFVDDQRKEQAIIGSAPQKSVRELRVETLDFL